MYVNKMEMENKSNEFYHELIKKSEEEVDPKLLERYIQNRSVDEPAYWSLISIYTVFIILGALGNTLVIMTVIRKPAMRTPRNLFILNLAVSDLLLCTIVMPLTLMEIISKYFPLGNNVFVCKFIGTLEATTCFVSTISITAIALDRYQVIVYPTKENLQLFGAALTLLFIWVLALMLAMPIFFVKRLTHHKIELDGISELNFCYELWPLEHGRAYYSIFTLIFQYTLPLIIVTAAYIRISRKLRYRFATGFVSSEESSQKSRHQLRGRRLKRTNLLLGSIAIIFIISWLPLNVFNLITDYYNIPFTDYKIIVFAICHMMGMSSACSNPILYGCLNENFWKEFKDILRCPTPQTGESFEESQKLSIRKQFQRVLGRSKPDLVTGATDYQPCNTASTDMTVLTS